jgi:hypothetical protein
LCEGLSEHETKKKDNENKRLSKHKKKKGVSKLILATSLAPNINYNEKT